MNDYISIKGARVHNLKNISVNIPKNKLVVITGLSGSGKSSLAFDTVFAEGQRRFIESMSTFARQFLGVFEKPDVDEIKNLSPALSIDQKTAVVSPRSTVGTMSEMYDYMRLLFTTIGNPYCSSCSIAMNKKSSHHLTKKEFEQINDWKCPKCELTFPKISISLFSFNSPTGACRMCHGLGQKSEIDPSSILPNSDLTIEEGGIRPLQRINSTNIWRKKSLNKLMSKYHFKTNTSIGRLSANSKKAILFGDEETEGVISYLTRRHDETDSDYLKKEIEKYMIKKTCPDCLGARLRKEAISVKVAGYNIIELTKLSIKDLQKIISKFIQSKRMLSKQEREVSAVLLNEIHQRSQFLLDVGLPYLSLDRNAQTLAGGEAQRIRLASQLGSGLVNVIYILDEPSIGLHSRDHDKLLKSIRGLQKLGNTVIVVEHDLATMEEADWIIDVGPKAGNLGGKIVGEGTIEDIKKSPDSITGQYLSGKKQISHKQNYRAGNTKKITIVNASQFNLKNITVDIPLQKFVVITGVSGSGKSTLVSDILAAYLSKYFYRAKSSIGKHDKITGVENVDKVIVVDQSPIGRNVRSNPATYTGLFTLIRNLYAGLPESEKKKFGPDSFSFNLIGGRCETCHGDGLLKFEMHFLPNVFITCEECNGSRYKSEIINIKYKNKSISDVLDMTVDEAKLFFIENEEIASKLEVFAEVGLGYLKLGQPATMLSGGEAQRVKLANELSRPSTGNTLYILDEPTTGLHFDDTARLLEVLNKLVDKGNTVIVVEHNLDIIKNADWIIDIGPEGGEEGGKIVAQGTPKDVVKVAASYTGQYLKKELR